MRILVIDRVPLRLTDSRSRIIYGTCLELAKRGHKVLLLTSSKNFSYSFIQEMFILVQLARGGADLILGALRFISHKFIGLQKLRFLHDFIQPYLLHAPLAMWLSQYYETFRPDVIIFEDYSIPLILGRELKKFKALTILHIHDIYSIGWRSKLYYILESKAFHAVDMIITLSYRDKVTLEKLFNVKAHYIGVTLHKLSNLRPNVSVIYEYRLKPYGYWLFPSGSLGGRALKALKICIDAIKELDDVLVVTGGICESIKERLQYRNIKILGFISNEDLHALYTYAKGILAPIEYYEGIPTKVIEGLLYGKPCIVHKSILGCFKGLHPGYNVIAIPHLNVDELKKAIKVSNDVSIYHKISREALKYAVEELSWTKIIDKLLQLIKLLRS